jgi:hippurate hydrolase
MFVFQPAEETLSGAAAMLEAGVFGDATPDAILGFHNWPQLPTGAVGWHAGAVMASSYAFDVTLRGVGGHGAHPHLAVDAIIAAAHFIGEVQTIVSREIAPIEPAVVTIGRVSGGTARNVIASSVELNGSVRTFDAKVADAIERALRRMLDGLKVGMRIDYTLDWKKVAPVLRNDPATMRRVLDSASEALGVENVVEMPSPSMGSEDFAWFAERIPAAHLRIGSKIDGHDTAIHRSDYRLNEDAIGVGVRVMTRAMIDLLR